jgi:acyl carrier protein
VSDTVEERTRRLVAEVFGLSPSQVTRETSNKTIEEWDSLNVLNVLMAVEGEFGVTISPEEAAEFVSVDKILNVLKTKGVA